MLYKNPFESLTILQFFYKWMPKECIKWCNWFQKFCIKNPSLYATTCSLGQFDEKKIIWNFFNFFNFETNGYKGNDSLIKSFG